MPLNSLSYCSDAKYLAFFFFGAELFSSHALPCLNFIGASFLANLYIIQLCFLLQIFTKNLAKISQQNLCHSLKAGCLEISCHINEFVALNLNFLQSFGTWTKCRLPMVSQPKSPESGFYCTHSYQHSGLLRSNQYHPSNTTHNTLLFQSTSLNFPKLLLKTSTKGF